MQTTVQTWGNSLGVRIPSLYAKKLKLQKGEIVTFELKTDQIILKKNKNVLKDLVDQISSENLHQEIPVDSVTGNEIW
jgi:antitoxin MazE